MAASKRGEDRALGPTGLRLEQGHLDLMVAHCLSCYPEEGCGLISGDPLTGAVTNVHPLRNAARSARIYTLDPREHLDVDLQAEASGDTILGVFHSHTHTEPYPSPTDVRQAPDPTWHYVLVGFRHEVPSVRSFHIEGGNISEETLVVLGNRI